MQIYDYINSRQFIKDYYSKKKQQQPSFSYQLFANKAGFKSKSFIYKVITGQKALSKSAVFSIAQAMNLKKRETAYFETIVNFTQAKTAREKEFYFNQIRSFGHDKKSIQLRRNQFDYFSRWYLPVVREIVTWFDFKDDFDVLAKALNPPISPAQAKNAVKLLCKLNLIERLTSGEYKQTENAITTGSEIKSLAVINFQKETMRLATEAIERFNRDHRDISSLTVGINESGVKRITEEITAFRKRLVKIADEEQSIDRVYQINIQLFPLTTIPEQNKS